MCSLVTTERDCTSESECTWDAESGECVPGRCKVATPPPLGGTACTFVRYTAYYAVRCSHSCGRVACCSSFACMHSIARLRLSIWLLQLPECQYLEEDKCAAPCLWDGNECRTGRLVYLRACAIVAHTGYALVRVIRAPFCLAECDKLSPADCEKYSDCGLDLGVCKPKGPLFAGPARSAFRRQPPPWLFAIPLGLSLH